MLDLKYLPDKKLAIIGLGYVGLPLAVKFGKRRRVIGSDVKAKRMAEQRAAQDSTREKAPDELAAAAHLSVTDDPAAQRGYGAPGLVFFSLKGVFAAVENALARAALQ